jgi:hypothetical protein
MRQPAARIFYFEKDKTPLILGAVEPFVRALRRQGDAPPVWLQAHWRQGPHLDVIADTTEARFDAEVLPLLHATAGSWLAEHPSTTAIDPEDYRRLSERLALYELETGALSPVQENNTIIRAWHEPNLQIFGVAELAEARARYNAASLDAILAALHIKTASPNDFYFRMAAMMALTGNFVRVHGLPRSYVSYRSHAEYFFTNHDVKGHARARLIGVEELLGAEIDRIVRSAHAVFLGETAVEDAFPELAGWYHECRALAEHVYGIAEANAELLGQYNRLGGLVDQVVGSLDVTLDPADERKSSEVEEYIGDINALFRQVSHIAYRTMVNFLYGIFPIMSVAPVQKYSLCHLVSNSCERVFGKSWKEVVDEGRPKAEITR